jgi:hypothetical protein
MTSLKSTLVILTSIGLLGAAGCAGILEAGDGDDITNPPVNPNPDPTTDTQGAQNFQQNILPLVSGCAGGGIGCHSGDGTDPLKFLGPGDQSLYYDSIVQYAQVHGDWDTARASLIEKLEIAAAGGGNHFGFSPFSNEQIMLIEQWFEIERTERANGGGTPGGGITTRDLLAEWSGCMSLANWEQSGMGTWALKGTQNGPCANCHSGGEYWIYVSANSEEMFQMNRQEVFITGFFATQGNSEVVPAYDKLVRMGQGNPNGGVHPTYNTNRDTDQYFLSLKSFYELTNAARLAGQCEPPGFPELPPPAP